MLAAAQALPGALIPPSQLQSPLLLQGEEVLFGVRGLGLCGGLVLPCRLCWGCLYEGGDPAKGLLPAWPRPRQPSPAQALGLCLRPGLWAEQSWGWFADSGVTGLAGARLSPAALGNFCCKTNPLCAPALAEGEVG